MKRQKTTLNKPVATTALMILAAGAMVASPLSTYAVHPQAWNHQTEADYTDGDFDNVVVNNFGELTLGRELKRVTTPADIEFVNSFAQTKAGDIYFVTSTNGKVYKIAGNHAVEYFAPPEDHPNLLSIAADAQGGVLVGACGDTAQLLRLATDAAGKVTSKVVFENPKVSYIWAIRPTADGAIYIATGPHGQVWKVADGKPAVVLDTKAKNVTALINDTNGNLIAGTDGNGLVIRIDAKTAKPYVLLDAGAVDITALTTDEAGNIYAAAGQPAEPQPPSVAEEPATPTKPGKVEPEVPDTAPAPEPADDGTDQPKPKPEKHNKKNVARKPAATSTGITLPGNGILADNGTQTTIKELLARLKASQRKGSPKVPKHLPRPETEKGPESHANNAPGDESEPDQGNVVYKIAPDGTNTILMHASDMVLSLLYHDGEVLVGTGNQGKLYSSKPASETEALIARIRDENIMTIFQANDGTVYVGTSDNGEVFNLSPHQAARGTYVSKVLNAGNAATWGTAALTATMADGAKASIATRTGNVEDVETQGNFWNGWSDEIPANTPKTISSPAAKYLQYRVTLLADPRGATPTVAQTRIAYQVQNLPPVLKNLSVDTTGGAGDSVGGDESSQGLKPDQPNHSVHVYWDASDPNHDDLTYRVLYRQVGTDLWVQLTKDLKDPAFDWNTREVPDGKYQLKVIASDAADNTPEDAKSVARVTPIIVINNTPPVIGQLAALAQADGSVKIAGHADDTVSSITEVRYQIDGYPDWHPAVASDKIFDSPSEGFSAETRVLPAGEHRVTVKATDAQGNVSYKAVMVTVK